MEPAGDGYYQASVPGAGPGAFYKFVLDGRELPDPFARALPEGVHGPARVEASDYVFQNAGVSPRGAQQVIYEIHVGTFTPEGTYEAARRHLPYLARLGVRTLELMPVASFAGDRGWGYDGVAQYAPFAPYGTPDDLRRFVDEAHGLGLSVLLDVVYNHFGPSGNYLSAYSDDYFVRGAEVGTPWGEAPNFACPAMRRLVIENALYWLQEFRFDGLRLDATHTIVDRSEEHVLHELTRRVRAHAQAPTTHLLCAEDERNDPATVASLGFDAIWADDFHHQLRVTLTSETDGYYGSYTAGVGRLAEAINKGWLYEGQVYPASGKPRGKPAPGMPPEAFVYCIQNHDQVGNRALGERLSADVSLAAYRAASVLLLFLPMTPLLFMGQEWAASTPFLYFTDHEGELGEAVARGRREEFRRFSAFSDPARRHAIPDPQALATFAASKLRWEERAEPGHVEVVDLYRELLFLRRSDPVLQRASRRDLHAEAKGEVLVVRRSLGDDVRVLCVNFGASPVALDGLGLPGVGLSTIFSSPARIDHGDLEGGDLRPHGAVILAGGA
jgi:maltooligosyltrehalose trehalohydrolase